MKWTKIHERNLRELIDREFDTVEEREPEFRVYCPFCDGGQHNDFSFDINVEKGVARCWRQKCDWRGPAVELVAEYYNVDRDHAKDILGGGEPDNIDDLKGRFGRMAQWADQESHCVETLDDLFDTFCAQIRGSQRITDTFETKRARQVRLWLKERGYDPVRFVNEHDLALPPNNDEYRGYVIFRTYMPNGQAYQLYAYTNEPYLKTKDPKGYMLPRCLYGYMDYYNVDNVDWLFITEGIFDAARLRRWNLPAVCAFGVHMSESQYAALSKLDVNELCVAFDHDADEHAERVCTDLKDYTNTDVRLTYISIEREGADPDELSQDEFLSYFKKRRQLERTTSEQEVNKLLSQYQEKMNV